MTTPALALRDLRQTHNLSLAGMGRRLGVSSKTIGHIEQGNQRVSSRMREAVLSEFGVTLPLEPERPSFLGWRLREGLCVYTAMALGLSRAAAVEMVGRDLDYAGRRLAAVMRVVRGELA